MPHLADVARLLNFGVDGLVLRTVKASELGEALEKILGGERVVAPAMSVGTIGRVGPNMELTPEGPAKERSFAQGNGGSG